MADLEPEFHSRGDGSVWSLVVDTDEYGITQAVKLSLDTRGNESITEYKDYGVV